MDAYYYAVELSPYLENVRKNGQADIAAVLDDAQELGNEFLSVFTGIFFDDSRLVSWHRQERLLPWFIEEHPSPVPAIEEIAAVQLSDAFDSDKWWEKLGDLTGDPQKQVQEIAVAGFLALDVLLRELACRGNLRRAMRYQNDVHRWVTHVHAFLRERVLRSQSDIASIAANARHAEHRAMKKDIWDWYKQNGHLYRSMDAAAEAAAGKIAPITFRTARAWIGQFKKSEAKHSARRL